FEIPEALFLNRGHELRAIAAEARRLVHHHTAAGLADRGAQRVHVERRHAAHVDDLRVDARKPHRRLGDVHHGAVSEHADFLTLAHQCGAADRHAVMAHGHLAARVRAPRHRGLVRIAVARPVVHAPGIVKQYSILLLDRYYLKTS